MHDIARSGDAKPASRNPFGYQSAHLRQVLGRRSFPARGALTHHIDPQRRVRDLRGDIDIELPRLQRVEVFWESFPVPRQAFDHHHFGNVFDPLHQLDQRIALIRPARRKADAAIAHHGRGHAMPGGGREAVFPGYLTIEMGVDVDKAGRDQLARRVDHFGGIAIDPADGNDPPVLDRHVADHRRRAGAIVNRPAANDQVIKRHCRILSSATDSLPGPALHRSFQRPVGAASIASATWRNRQGLT